MLIAQISDMHITGKGEKAYGVAPVSENLARCVDHINQLLPKPDLVLVTGDITNRGQLHEAENAVQILQNLHCPYYIVPGNHDDRSVLRTAFDDQTCPPTSEAFISYVIDGHELRLIAMDTVNPGQPGGKICAKRAKWLEDCLSKAPAQPTIIFMHHPPLRFGVLETDEDGFEGVDLLADVVSKYSNIERILCGHIHLQAFARWSGTVVSTAPSMGMRLVLDLTLKQPSQFTLEDPAYQLHYWSPDKNLISHTVRVGDVEGPLRGRF